MGWRSRSNNFSKGSRWANSPSPGASEDNMDGASDQEDTLSKDEEGYPYNETEVGRIDWVCSPVREYHSLLFGPFDPIFSKKWNKEIKLKDYPNNGTAALLPCNNGGGFGFPMLSDTPNITRGSGPDQRIGDRIQYLRVQVRGRLRGDIQALVNWARFLIIWQFDVNGNSVPPLGVSQFVLGLTAFPNDAYRKTYMVLYDRLAHNLGNAENNIPANRGLISGNPTDIAFDLDLEDLECCSHYQTLSASGLTANILTGAFRFITIGDGNPTAVSPEYEVCFRFWYVDV